MKSITKQKTFDEIREQLADFDRLFIIGCGTCTTMTKTGGIEQVLEMKEQLQELGKRVSGWTVIPTACDDMTADTLEQNQAAIDSANAILVMSCALGVHRVSMYIKKPVIPALDTLFIGLEDSYGEFHEVCDQCGQCVLGETAGILILICGGYLAARRYLNWRIPVGIFVTVFVFSEILYLINGEAFPPPFFMLFSGGLMLGAMYMATDMVTSPVTNRGAWIFAVGIGILVVLIRVWGGLPEGVMYAILLMNALVPFIDRATQPRIFGHLPETKEAEA